MFLFQQFKFRLFYFVFLSFLTYTVYYICVSHSLEQGDVEFRGFNPTNIEHTEDIREPTNITERTGL